MRNEGESAASCLIASKSEDKDWATISSSERAKRREKFSDIAGQCRTSLMFKMSIFSNEAPRHIGRNTEKHSKFTL
jgi:hypothetical protein